MKDGLRLHFLDQEAFKKRAFKIVGSQGPLSDEEYERLGLRKGGLQPSFMRGSPPHRQAILALVAALTVQSRRRVGLPYLQGLAEMSEMKGQSKPGDRRPWVENGRDKLNSGGTRGIFQRQEGSGDYVITIPTDLDEIVEKIASKQLAGDLVDQANRLHYLLDRFADELDGDESSSVSMEIFRFLFEWRNHVQEALELASAASWIPLAPADHVARPDLEARLENWRKSGSRRRVLIVHGPEGSGKSGLLRGFVDFCREPDGVDGAEPARKRTRSPRIHYHDANELGNSLEDLRKALSEQARHGEDRRDIDELLAKQDFVVLDHISPTPANDDLAALVRRQIQHPQQNIRIIAGWAGKLPEWASGAQQLGLENELPAETEIILTAGEAIPEALVRPAAEWLEENAPDDIGVAINLKREIVSKRIDKERLESLGDEIRSLKNDPELYDLVAAASAVGDAALTRADLSVIFRLRSAEVAPVVNRIRDCPGVRVTSDHSLHTGPLFRAFVNSDQLVHGDQLIAEAFVAHYAGSGVEFHPTYLSQLGIKHVNRSLTGLVDKDALLRAICNKEWLEFAWRDSPRRLRSEIAELTPRLGPGIQASDLAPLTLEDLNRLIREACQIGEIATGQSFWGSLHNASLSLDMDAQDSHALKQLAIDRGDARYAYLKLSRDTDQPLKRLWTYDEPRKTIKAVRPIDGGRAAVTFVNGGVAIVKGGNASDLRASNASIVAPAGEDLVVGSPDGLRSFTADTLAEVDVAVLQFDGVKYSPVDILPYGHRSTLTLARAIGHSRSDDVLIEHDWARGGKLPLMRPTLLPGKKFRRLLGDGDRGTIVYGSDEVVRVSHQGRIESLDDPIEGETFRQGIGEVVVEPISGTVVIASDSGLFAVSSVGAVKIDQEGTNFNALVADGNGAVLAGDDFRLIRVDLESPGEPDEIEDVHQTRALCRVGDRICCLASRSRLLVVGADRKIVEIQLPHGTVGIAAFEMTALLSWTKDHLTAWDLSEIQPTEFFPAIDSLAVTSEPRLLAVAIRESSAELHIDGLAMEAEPIESVREVVGLDDGGFLVRSDRDLWTVSVEGDRLQRQPVDVASSEITAFCADADRILLASSENGTGRLTEMRSGTVAEAGQRFGGPISRLAFSRGRIAALFRDREEPSRFEIGISLDETEIRTIKPPFLCTAVAWAGDHLLLGDDSGTVHLYDRHPRDGFNSRDGFRISTGDRRIERILPLDSDLVVLQTNAHVYVSLGDSIIGAIAADPDAIDVASADSPWTWTTVLAREGKLEWGKLIRRE